MSENPGVAPKIPSPPAASRADAAGSANRVLLVGYGILAGIFVLYAIGWALGLSRQAAAEPVTAAAAPGMLEQFLTILTASLAVASGPLWFASVFILTRKNGTAVKLAWQALGVVLLVPWIFIVVPISSAGA